MIGGADWWRATLAKEPWWWRLVFAVPFANPLDGTRLWDNS